MLDLVRIPKKQEMALAIAGLTFGTGILFVLFMIILFTPTPNYYAAFITFIPLFIILIYCVEKLEKIGEVLRVIYNLKFKIAVEEDDAGNLYLKGVK